MVLTQNTRSSSLRRHRRLCQTSNQTLYRPSPFLLWAGCVYYFSQCFSYRAWAVWCVGVWRSAWAVLSIFPTHLAGVSYHRELIKAGSSLQSVPVCQLPTGKKSLSLCTSVFPLDINKILIFPCLPPQIAQYLHACCLPASLPCQQPCHTLFCIILLFDFWILNYFWIKIHSACTPWFWALLMGP